MRRVAIAVLQRPAWSPPGIGAAAWQRALAEDVLDVLAMLAQVDAAVAVADSEASLAREVGWPGLPAYVLPRLDVPSVLAAAAADGYEQAALLAGDCPDLPGMIIAKLLRPLTTRPASAAPAVGGGLLGLAARLPAPNWLPASALDDLSLAQVRRGAPSAGQVARATEWHRLRQPADLAYLDPRLEGWEATRALLSGGR